MAQCTPEEIVKAVTQHQTDTDDLRNRMERDWDLYTLKEYTGTQIDEKGFRHYTSNEPGTFADKTISLISGADPILRVPYEDDPKEERDRDDAYEMFLRGLLKAGDDRLSRLIDYTSLLESLSFQACIRGWVAGRAMLTKRDGKTFVDITPFDPLHTFWSVGEDGLEWLCYRTRKTRSEIQALYDVDMGDDIGPEGVEVFDYLDSEHNTICTAEKKLKESTPHGSPRVPAFIIPVGPTPRIHTRLGSSKTTIEHHGESIYRTVRNLYPIQSEIASIVLHMVALARKRPLFITSPDGNKTLEENPYFEGRIVSLAEGDKVDAPDLLDIAAPTAGLQAFTDSQIQRGALPYTAYGELNVAISGYAIDTLNQGYESVLLHPLSAIRRAYRQILLLLTDQFLTGSFPALELSGFQENRKYFSQTFTEEMIKGSGDFEFDLVPTLPEDDAAKMAYVQMAREGPVPMLSDRYLRDRKLMLRDADRMEVEIKEQMGERMLPEATLLDVLRALEEAGRPELAQLYEAKLEEYFRTKAMAEAQAKQQAQQQSQQQGLDGGAQSNGRPTFNPTVLPDINITGRPPDGLSNPGPQVPPGTPRPGAQFG